MPNITVVGQKIKAKSPQEKQIEEDLRLAEEEKARILIS